MNTRIYTQLASATYTSNNSINSNSVVPERLPSFSQLHYPALAETSVEIVQKSKKYNIENVLFYVLICGYLCGKCSVHKSMKRIEHIFKDCYKCVFYIYTQARLDSSIQALTRSQILDKVWKLWFCTISIHVQAYTLVSKQVYAAMYFGTVIHFHASIQKLKVVFSTVIV